MTTTQFEATKVHAESEMDVIIVGFANEEVGEYLLLQKSLSSSPQDKELAIHKIHISYKEQANSTYGGVRKCLLTEDRVQIHIDSDAATALGAGESIEIRLSVSESILHKLESHLESLFDDQPGAFISRV